MDPWRITLLAIALATVALRDDAPSCSAGRTREFAAMMRNTHGTAWDDYVGKARRSL